jgi:glycosyltransferase involved in cell wall biosynthesis
MHVGIVAPCSSGVLADLLPSSGGADVGCGGYLIATLVRALIGRGHHVSVITLSPELTERRILQGPQLTYYVYPMRTQRKMRDLFRVERQGLKEGILLANPDILHAHWTYEFALACLEMHIPTIITSHDNAFQVLRFSRDMYRLGRLYLQIRVMRQARFLTAVSPYLANSLRWLAQAEIEVVPNPIEVPQKAECYGDQAPGSVRIATVLNGWGKRKNPQAAIQAFYLLRCEIPHAEMFMYGEDFEAYGLASQWAASRGLSRNIHFCGFQPYCDLLKKLREMSILLHPALEESCGMVLLEAMSVGLPVVGGIGSGAVPWVLDEGRAGFLTNMRYPEQIAATLLTCLGQVDERKRKQSNAYERVLSMFSPSAVAEKYEKLYTNALSV